MHSVFLPQCSRNLWKYRINMGNFAEQGLLRAFPDLKCKEPDELTAEVILNVIVIFDSNAT